MPDAHDAPPLVAAPQGVKLYSLQLFGVMLKPAHLPFWLHHVEKWPQVASSDILPSRARTAELSVSPLKVADTTESAVPRFVQVLPVPHVPSPPCGPSVPVQPVEVHDT